MLVKKKRGGVGSCRRSYQYTCRYITWGTVILQSNIIGWIGCICCSLEVGTLKQKVENSKHRMVSDYLSILLALNSSPSLPYVTMWSLIAESVLTPCALNEQFNFLLWKISTSPKFEESMTSITQLCHLTYGQLILIYKVFFLRPFEF